MATKQPGGTDVFQMLRQDHQNVTRIMDHMRKAGHHQKQQLFNQLQDELESHMSLEERFFYPRMENIDELSDLIEDSLSDHEDIREIIQQMNEQEFDSNEWQENCQALEDSKEDHVDREEQEVFPQAMEFVGEHELTRIAEEITTEKGKVAPSPGGRRQQERPPRVGI